MHRANDASNDVHRPPLLISLTSQVKALFRWVLINCAELEVNLKLVPDVLLKAPRSNSALVYWLVSCQHTRSFDSEMFPTSWYQGCIFRLTCSHPELTEDHVLKSVYVKIFRTVTRNAVNKRVWRKKDCSWLPLNKHAMNIWLSSLRIRAHLSWRTVKHLHVLHVLQTYSTCSHPGW